MSGTYTDRLSLYRPARSEENWDDEVNANFTILDDAALISDLEDYASNLLSVVTVSGSRDLELTDRSKILEVNGNYTLTVPPESSVAFPTGSILQVFADTASTVTVASGSGVTLQSESGFILNAQYSIATLRKRATDIWHLYGSLRSS